MPKEDNEDFNIPSKCWICDNDYIDNDVKVTDHSHMIRKCQGSAHRNFNINLSLDHKINVVFYNLKFHDSHIIVHALGQFNLKINITANGLEKYVSLTINNMWRFIGRFQFLSSSWDRKLESLESLKKNYQKDGCAL